MKIMGWSEELKFSFHFGKKKVESAGFSRVGQNAANKQLFLGL